MQHAGGCYSITCKQAQSLLQFKALSGGAIVTVHYYHTHIVTLIIYHLVTLLLGSHPYLFRINHQCHIDGSLWTYALYRLLACYNKDIRSLIIDGSLNSKQR